MSRMRRGSGKVSTLLSMRGASATLFLLRLFGVSASLGVGSTDKSFGPFDIGEHCAGAEVSPLIMAGAALLASMFISGIFAANAASMLPQIRGR